MVYGLSPKSEEQGWVTAPLTITAVHHKLAASFTGICAECDHCGEWRRCGASVDCEKTVALYCSEACQQAASSQAGMKRE